MKAISFLGTGNYKETTYQYAGQQFTTQFFATALPYFFPEVDKVLVFVTPTVKNHDNFSALSACLGEKMQAVQIPEGHSEDELWQIFDRLIETVQEGDTVIFDITHSFRSLPFITFLAASFLRAARNVHVHKIVYGAWEARNIEQNVSPVFDLTPFIALLDWLTATQQFLETGNAQGLARFLIQGGIQKQLGSLKNAGQTLEQLSLQMMLTRPLEVLPTANKFSERLDKVENEGIPYPKPFTLLLHRIQDEYASKALPNPEENVPQALLIQLELVDWYIQKDLIMQAVTLAREWIVTAVGWKYQQRFILNKEERKEIEIALSGISKMGLKDSGISFEDLNSIGKALWNDFENPELLRKLMDLLIQIRNDIDHAGMSVGAMKAETLAKRTKEEIVPHLKKVAALMGILEN